MYLSAEEKKLILKRRAEERERMGAIECWACDGTGSASQSDCETCDGRGWFLKTAPEVKKRVTELRKNKREAAKAYDAAIKSCL